MNLQRSREQLRKKKVQKISLQAGAQVKLNDKLHQLSSNQIISWMKKKKKKEKKKEVGRQWYPPTPAQHHLPLSSPPDLPQRLVNNAPNSPLDRTAAPGTPRH